MFVCLFVCFAFPVVANKHVYVLKQAGLMTKKIQNKKLCEECQQEKVSDVSCYNCSFFLSITEHSLGG